MIELNVRYTLTTPPGTISSDGVEQIVRYINQQWLPAEDWQKLNPETTLRYLPSLPTDWQWVWVVTDKEADYVGNFPTRVRSFYYKRYGLKCPQSFLTQLGNLARRYSESTPVYHFDFVNRFDWNDGDFGDAGSCFWADRSDALTMLYDNGAWAVRFFDDNGDGYARAWFVNIGESLYVVFNGYGFPTDSTFIIARTIAQWLKLSFKRIDVSNNGVNEGTMWINGGTGYIIGVVETIDQYSDYDLDWEDDGAYACYNCGTRLNEYDMYFGADDNTYCEHCYYDRFDSCEQCSNTHWREDIIHTGDSRYLCERCLDRESYQSCDNCGEWYPADTMQYVDDQLYCEGCRE
jgi:hypothetical protein